MKRGAERQRRAERPLCNLCGRPATRVTRGRAPEAETGGEVGPRSGRRRRGGAGRERREKASSPPGRRHITIERGTYPEKGRRRLSLGRRAPANARNGGPLGAVSVVSMSLSLPGLLPPPPPLPLPALPSSFVVEWCSGGGGRAGKGQKPPRSPLATSTLLPIIEAPPLGRVVSSRSSLVPSRRRGPPFVSSQHRAPHRLPPPLIVLL